jgi:hypothetical protein
MATMIVPIDISTVPAGRRKQHAPQLRHICGERDRDNVPSVLG